MPSGHLPPTHAPHATEDEYVTVDEHAIEEEHTRITENQPRSRTAPRRRTSATPTALRLRRAVIADGPRSAIIPVEALPLYYAKPSVAPRRPATKGWRPPAIGPGEASASASASTSLANTPSSSMPGTLAGTWNPQHHTRRDQHLPSQQDFPITNEISNLMNSQKKALDHLRALLAAAEEQRKAGHPAGPGELEKQALKIQLRQLKTENNIVRAGWRTASGLLDDFKAKSQAEFDAVSRQHKEAVQHRANLADVCEGLNTTTRLRRAEVEALHEKHKTLKEKYKKVKADYQQLQRDAMADRDGLAEQVAHLTKELEQHRRQ